MLYFINDIIINDIIIMDLNKVLIEAKGTISSPEIILLTSLSKDN